jgi:hypothetical protein
MHSATWCVHLTDSAGCASDKDCPRCVHRVEPAVINPVHGRTGRQPHDRPQAPLHDGQRAGGWHAVLLQALSHAKLDGPRNQHWYSLDRIMLNYQAATGKALEEHVSLSTAAHEQPASDLFTLHFNVCWPIAVQHGHFCAAVLVEGWMT